MKCLIIIPYFGKLPNYFALWLKSVRKNPNFHWLLILDDKTTYDYLENCRVEYTSFDSLKESIAAKFDFPISLESPYKLCDFRPAYGYLFKEYIEGYDFWGYGDFDLIYGDLSKFITAELLNTYDKILPNGHLTLYRNNESVNSAFRLQEPDLPFYKNAFSSSGPFYFDEWPGITTLLDRKGFKQYTGNIAADMAWLSYRFKHTKPEFQNYKKTYFVWEDGRLYQVYKDSGIHLKEVAYIHLQKRKMKLKNTISEYEKATAFAIMPDSFAVIKPENMLDEHTFKQYTQFNLINVSLFYREILIRRWRSLKRKSGFFR